MSKKCRVEISINDPIGTDKDGNEIALTISLELMRTIY